jgi:hypothetical protein
MGNPKANYNFANGTIWKQNATLIISKKGVLKS